MNIKKKEDIQSKSTRKTRVENQNSHSFSLQNIRTRSVIHRRKQRIFKLSHHRASSLDYSGARVYRSLKRKARAINAPRDRRKAAGRVKAHKDGVFNEGNGVASYITCANTSEYEIALARRRADEKIPLIRSSVRCIHYALDKWFITRIFVMKRLPLNLRTSRFNCRGYSCQLPFANSECIDWGFFSCAGERLCFIHYLCSLIVQLACGWRMDVGRKENYL